MIINTSFYFSGQYDGHSHPKNREVFVHVQGMKSDGKFKNVGKTKVGPNSFKWRIYYVIHTRPGKGILILDLSDAPSKIFIPKVF